MPTCPAVPSAAAPRRRSRQAPRPPPTSASRCPRPRRIASRAPAPGPPLAPARKRCERGRRRHAIGRGEPAALEQHRHHRPRDGHQRHRRGHGQEQHALQCPVQAPRRRRGLARHQAPRERRPQRGPGRKPDDPGHDPSHPLGVGEPRHRARFEQRGSAPTPIAAGTVNRSSPRTAGERRGRRSSSPPARAGTRPPATPVAPHLPRPPPRRARAPGSRASDRAPPARR